MVKFNKKSKQDILSFFIDPSDLIQRIIYPQIIGRTVQFSKAVIWGKFKYKQQFPHLLSTLTEQVFIFPATTMPIFFWPERRFGTYCMLFQVTRRVFNNEKVSLVALPSAARLKMYCVSFSFFFFLVCVSKVDNGPGRSQRRSWKLVIRIATCHIETLHFAK